MFRLIILCFLLISVFVNVSAADNAEFHSDLSRILVEGISNEQDTLVIIEALKVGSEADVIMASLIAGRSPDFLKGHTNVLIDAYLRSNEGIALLPLEAIGKSSPPNQKILEVLRGYLGGDLLERIRLYREVHVVPSVGGYLQNNIIEFVLASASEEERLLAFTCLSKGARDGGSFDADLLASTLMATVDAGPSLIDRAGAIVCLGIIHPALKNKTKQAVNTVLSETLRSNDRHLALFAARESLSIGIHTENALSVAASSFSEPDQQLRANASVLFQKYVSKDEAEALLRGVVGENEVVEIVNNIYK